MKNKLLKYCSALIIITIYWVLFKRATSGLDNSWDSLSYHLPFAARLAGIVDYDRLILRPIFEARYHGYPVLAELIQGWLWRIFGKISYANTLGLFSLFSINFYLAWRLKESFLKITIYLLSVPLILIHSASSYNDLFHNVFFAIALIHFTLAIAEKRFSERDFYIIAFSLALSLNSKYLLLPFIILLFLGLLILAVKQKLFSSWKKLTILATLLGLIIFAVPVKNLIFYGNPLYPLTVKLGPLTFEGVPEEYNSSKEPAVKGVGFVRFIKSFFEYDLYTEGRTSLFSVDQSAGSAQYVSSKMGGYFVFNIVTWLLILIISCYGSNDRFPKIALIVFAGLFLIVGLLHPGPYLRYWLFLPIFLLATALRCLQSIEHIPFRQYLYVFQLCLFCIVLRLCWDNYFDRLPKLKLTDYKIADLAQENCVVLQERKILFMALANQQSSFYGVNREQDCPQGLSILKKHSP